MIASYKNEKPSRDGVEHEVKPLEKEDKERNTSDCSNDEDDTATLSEEATKEAHLKLRDASADTSTKPQTISNEDEASTTDEISSAKEQSSAADEDVEVEEESPSESEPLLPQICQICGQGSMGNTRAMVRFLPCASAKSDISLHVFCGKIASILPQIAQPHLEILVTAGLKNKHGIGPYVNFALARTRSAIAQGGEAEKDPRRLDKEYYLVQEFEEHLKSIRGLQLNRKGAVASIPPNAPPPGKPKVHKASKKPSKVKGPFSSGQKQEKKVETVPFTPKPPSTDPSPLDKVNSCPSVLPNLNANGGTSLPNQARSLEQAKGTAPVRRTAALPSKSTKTRIRCPCGGMYKGPARWKAHLKTPRHVLWQSHNTPAPACPAVDTDSKQMLPLQPWQNSNSLGLPLPRVSNDRSNFSLAQQPPRLEGNSLEGLQSLLQNPNALMQARVNETLMNCLNERRLGGVQGRIDEGVLARLGVAGRTDEGLLSALAALTNRPQAPPPSGGNSQSLSPSLLLLLLLLNNSN